MKDLSGKWALVTGASRGIGQQIAIALAKRGCNLILHARIVENLDGTLEAIKGTNCEVACVGAELSSEQAVQGLIDFVLDEVGYADYIYNNAGIQNDWCDTFDNGMDVWKYLFQVNTFSIVQICNALIPKMVERGYGRVINTSTGIEGVPQMASYGASKWAVDKFTSELAYETKDVDVTVTALDPGWLKTDLGGPDADHDVETVIPGALAPIITDDIENGTKFHAQELRNIEG